MDIQKREIYYGRVQILNSTINILEKIGPQKENLPFILPGFVDAHIHIESSMLTPSQFGKMAVRHGTVATVSDPHEIANVMGLEGVDYMIKDGSKVPLKFYFGAPSCVPATAFESAGAVIDPDGVENLLQRQEIVYLAEMMNYPGVVHGDQEVMKKIDIAHRLNKPIDGHAPGLRGSDLRKYISAGISTDHECFTKEEAEEKLSLGMKIILREGSAAKNYNALHELIDEHHKMMMFCSDDKHPDDLLEGHINQLVTRALRDGHDLYNVLQMACINPVEHYNLNVGTLKEKDPADFIIVQNLENFKILATYIEGEKVADGKHTFFEPPSSAIINQFNVSPCSASDFQLNITGNRVRCIHALDGELITRELIYDQVQAESNVQSFTDADILKIAVVNRYQSAPPAVALIHGIGLKKGAIASCVAHDSHNIISVGVDDMSIMKATNAIIQNKGGISIFDGENVHVLPLPIAGIMTNDRAESVGAQYQSLDALAKSLGSTLKAPFMTLSFMALLVIPQLKLSDKGLFDGQDFKFVDVNID